MKNLLEERAYMALLMTMEKQSDRELLELAAKAAGVVGEFDHGYQCIMQEVPFRGHLINYENWNPLADDGDALRLAAKLTLVVDILVHQTRVDAEQYGIRRCIEHVPPMHEISPSDTLAATRRAITRAAAEIGRRMQDEQSTVAAG